MQRLSVQRRTSRHDLPKTVVLAQLTKKGDPDEALLAGLIHNIGALPILTFSDSLPSGTYQLSDIELCMNELQGQTGYFILERGIL
jgi:HD-like signal output (HDOD) protein